MTPIPRAGSFPSCSPGRPFGNTDRPGFVVGTPITPTLPGSGCLIVTPPVRRPGDDGLQLHPNNERLAANHGPSETPTGGLLCWPPRQNARVRNSDRGAHGAAVQPRLHLVGVPMCALEDPSTYDDADVSSWGTLRRRHPHRPDARFSWSTSGCWAALALDGSRLSHSSPAGSPSTAAGPAHYYCATGGRAGAREVSPYLIFIGDGRSLLTDGGLGPEQRTRSSGSCRRTVLPGPESPVRPSVAPGSQPALQRRPGGTNRMPSMTTEIIR